ncbi:unnamed protein product [Urochloa humidicola]
MLRPWRGCAVPAWRRGSSARQRTSSSRSGLVGDGGPVARQRRLLLALVAGGAIVVAVQLQLVLVLVLGVAVHGSVDAVPVVGSGAARRVLVFAARTTSSFPVAA